MRLIDADRLKEEIKKKFGYSSATAFVRNMQNLSQVEVFKHIMKLIEVAPMIAERPQGKWARHDEWVGGVYVGGFYHVNCSCEDGYYSKWETNFCPNCGQPMKKGAEE